MQIFDAVTWPNTLIAELFVPIPEVSMVTGAVDKEPFEFSSDHFVSYKHSGVGSGRCIIFVSFTETNSTSTSNFGFSTECAIKSRHC